MLRTMGRSGPFLSQFFRSVAILLVTLVVAAPAAAEPVRGRVLDPDTRPVAFADVLILRGSQVVAATSAPARRRAGGARREHAQGQYRARHQEGVRQQRGEL